jgi:GDP-4-dehydro-6-deoxy-D-mannose reductase
LITGIAGFAGSHLAEHLLSRSEWEIYGVMHPQLDTDAHIAPFRNELHLVEGDLLDPDSVKSNLEEIRPDFLFHLAAQAFVPTSWEDPWKTFENNVRGQLNLLQAIIDLQQNPRLLVVGSADEYGLVTPEEMPLAEATPLRPLNPYAVSKVAQDLLGFQYFASHELQVIRVRSFNHIGPRQRDTFVAGAFARQIAEAERGLREPVISVGNLEAKRDLSDARDIVRGYYLAISLGEPGEVYNLGSERAYAISHLLEVLLELSTVSLQVETDPSRFRPVEVPIVLSDCSKVREKTGWKAEIPLRDSLRDVLDYWRHVVSHAG